MVWAVTRDGEVYNLGELLASKPKGSRQFTTANKSFALLVTAVATQTASAQTGKGGILNRMKSAVTGSQRSTASRGWRTHKSSYRSARKKPGATQSEVDRAVAIATGRIAATPASAVAR